MRPGEIASVLNIRRQKYKNAKAINVNIILESPHLLSGFPDSTVSWAKAYLRTLGVKLLICSECYVSQVRPNMIYLRNGTHVTYTMFIWTGGVSASPLLNKTGLKIGEKRRVAVNKYLQAEGRQDVFVVGDESSLYIHELMNAAP